MTEQKSILNRKKIVIIDDDKFSVLLTRMKLRKYTDDFNINVLNSFSKAVEFFDELSEKSTAMMPDLILLETMIDDARGWDLILHFEEITKHVSKPVKLVVLTSSQFFSDYRRSKQFGSVNGFLIKPLQITLLEEVVNGGSGTHNMHENMLLNSFIA
ncbi:MAG: response regulator [Bacteroidales bacterium]